MRNRGGPFVNGPSGIKRLKMKLEAGQSVRSMIDVVCGVVPGVVGYCVMQATNSRNPQLEAELRRTARPDSLMMGQVNRERLAEYLGELQRKEDTNDRYVAALRGETLIRKPYERIQPIPKENTTVADRPQQK
ncbi:hypothetical protein KPL71_025213 [Citrus sinensis]|uniref:Uncharacterized protein n=1 Tax=Citrus sinensis TaxID=2711 RepID=A0ACB8HQA2_CITSI|nr:hypothetical protein KPL71_025213 [Citrus sinensis]